MRDLLHELLHLSTASIDVEIDAARFRRNDVPIVQGDGDPDSIRARLDSHDSSRTDAPRHPGLVEGSHERGA